MSKTNYLKLNKHDNVTINENEFDIENYMNFNWDKIDENVERKNTEIARISENVIQNTTDITNIKTEQTTQNTKIKTLETDNIANKTKIKRIEEKDVNQDTSIIELQKENIELNQEIEQTKQTHNQEIKDIENTMPSANVKAEYVHIEDSSDYKAKVLPEGNVKQDGEPSMNNPILVQTLGNNKNLIDDTSYKNIEVTSNNINNIAYLAADLKANKNYVARIYFDDNTYAADNDSSFMLYAYNESKVQINTMPNNFAKLHIADIKYVKILANASGISKYANKKIKGIKIEEVKDTTAKASEYSPYRTRLS